MLVPHYVVLIQTVNTVIKLSGNGLLFSRRTNYSNHNRNLGAAAYVLYLSAKQLSDTAPSVVFNGSFMSLILATPPRLSASLYMASRNNV